MDTFLRFTHSSSGDVVYYKAKQIQEVRQSTGKTLIVLEGREQGAYVNEKAEYILDQIFKATGGNISWQNL